MMPARQEKKCPKCGQNTLVKNGKTAGGKQRWRCREGGGERRVCYSTTNPDAPCRDQASRPRKADHNPKFQRKLGKRAFLVTWAQNATPVHAGFKGAADGFLRTNPHAELIVIPGRYKNATSIWTPSQENAEWWVPEVEPYLFNQRRKLNDSLTLLAHLKPQPTRVRPLSGKEGMTHGESGIVGHPKLQLVSIPTPQNRLPKTLTTTGAITRANYTDSDAGAQGEFHHVLGACLVEIVSRSKFHLHQINARDDGAFIHMNTAYYPDGSTGPAGQYEALAMGDTHYRFMDPMVERATFGPGGLVEALDPKALVFHDLLDGYSVSPHHVNNPLIRIAKHRAGFDQVEREVSETIDWTIRVVANRQAYIVASNHDDMLSRWVMREDWKNDAMNAEFYLETALAMVRSAKMGATGAEYLDPFQYFVAKRGVPNIKCLVRNEHLSIKKIEMGYHGDHGPNGARGSIKNLARIGTKVMSGHGHAQGIEEGHYRLGTSTRLSAEYTNGPSSWSNTHGSIDAFGKRHLHTIIDGAFRDERNY